MDRSFNSSLLNNRSPFSPRSRPNISVRKSTLPPAFRKSSRFSASGKSTQSVQIILKSPFNYVERFGQPLPVLITEALTFAERNAVVSARISECSYAWVVCGRRLLIWQYRQNVPQQSNTFQRKTLLTNQCFELQLPQSDLAHRAELVTVFVTVGTRTPSCLAVSPEGVLRYWPAVAHESVYIEQTVDLQGEECDSLTNIDGLGCILATTTCTVVLVQPQIVNGRQNLVCKQLKAPSGWLGGISKRMSFIFGAPEHTAETRLVRILTASNGDGSWTVYVLAGHSLQKWRLSSHEPEQLIFVVELNRLVRESYYSVVWENCGGDQSEIDTWLLDIQSDKDGIIILAAAVNMHVSPQVHYSMISLSTNSSESPTKLRDFYILKMSGLYREDNPGDTLSYRFLLCSNCAYLYNERSITVIKPQEEPDTLEFNSSMDYLLGGSVCVNTPIFFSRTHGLVAVTPNELSDVVNLSLSMTGHNLSIDQSFSAAATSHNLTVFNIDPSEMLKAHTDTLAQIKAAFILHIKNQQSAYQEIIQQLFPAEISTVPSVDSIMDSIVVTLCENLLNDIPAGDPRWEQQTTQPGVGSSYSMQVLHQLEDKEKALILCLKFLQDSGIYARLTAVTSKETIVATTHVLAELSEKITAAIVLKNLQKCSLLEKAIEEASKSYETFPENGLTYQDVFYCKVTQVQGGLRELVQQCESLVRSDLNPAQIVESIVETNEIVLTVLGDVFKAREINCDNFAPSEAALSLGPEFLPWTAASGPEGLSDSLVLLHTLTFNYGVKVSVGGNQKNLLCDNLVALTDFILDGRKKHLESVKDKVREALLRKQYVVDKHKLIKPLLEEREYERAAQLAEKYLDFETLILICEANNNQARLDDYISRFSEDGFADYAYNWFLKENKQGKLIDRCRKKDKSANSDKIKSFLSGHPSLSWMPQIFDKNYSSAADTLRKIAMEETESLTRQKTAYSLSKLAKLASPNSKLNDHYVENINAQLTLIAYQEDLPDYVLQEYGFDTVNPKVLTPKELINLYICKEYSNSNELDFKKALDLLAYVTDSEVREELCLKVWRAAILRDSWNFEKLDAPLDILQNTLFFKIVDLCVMLGADLQQTLPPLDIIIEDASMSELLTNKSFQFLIKTGYEHIFRSSNN